jgi:hypothetical protein
MLRDLRTSTGPDGCRPIFPSTQRATIYRNHESVHYLLGTWPRVRLPLSLTVMTQPNICSFQSQSDPARPGFRRPEQRLTRAEQNQSLSTNWLHFGATDDVVKSGSLLGLKCTSSKSEEDTDGICAPLEERKTATRVFLKTLSALRGALSWLSRSVTSTLCVPPYHR